MLADAKCDVSMKDCNGLTAADVADKAKEADILNFLKVGELDIIFTCTAMFRFRVNKLLMICLQGSKTRVGLTPGNWDFVKYQFIIFVLGQFQFQLFVGGMLIMNEYFSNPRLQGFAQL